MNRKSLLTFGVLLVLVTMLAVAPFSAFAQEEHPLKGQTIDMSILGIGIDWQQVIKGLVLLAAVCFDVYNKGKA